MAIADILAKNIDRWAFRAAPAEESAIASLVAASGFPLPSDYLDFLRVSNGGEGDLGIDPGWFWIWPAEEVMNNNVDYQLTEFAPNFFAFCTNGGGEFFCFDRRRTDNAVLMLPAITMVESDAQQIVQDFEGFVMAFGVPHPAA